MYAIPKDSQTVRSKYGHKMKLNISQIYKIVRSPACLPGEYAVFIRADGDKDKFTIFDGYVNYDDVCDWFEIIHFNRSK